MFMIFNEKNKVVFKSEDESLVDKELRKLKEDGNNYTKRTKITS